MVHHDMSHCHFNPRTAFLSFLGFRLQDECHPRKLSTIIDVGMAYETLCVLKYVQKKYKGDM